MNELSIFDFGIEDTHYDYRKQFRKGESIRLFEAFAGVGMQRMAFNRLQIPYVSVGVSEIDKYALMAYKAVHGDCRNYGDITKMKEIPPCDVFTWSFPCTDLSKAGKQKGLQGGTRSGLVYEVLRLLKATEDKPKVLIMENVVDLVQVKFAAEFYEIQKEIERLGYENHTQVLNAKEHGVAQNRERVFMVSILGGGRYEFPVPVPLKWRLKDYLEEKVEEKYYLTGKMIERIGKWNAQQNPLENIEKEKPISPRLTARGAGEEHSGMVLVSEPRIVIEGNYMPSGKGNANILGKEGIAQAVMENHGTVQAITQAFMPKIEEASIDIPSLYGDKKAVEGDGVICSRTEQTRSPVQHQISHALRSGNCSDSGVVQNLRIRKLTPKECGRLMSIDDDDITKILSAVSNSQAYKIFGNGIVVDVFAGLLKGLCEL